MFYGHKGDMMGNDLSSKHREKGPVAFLWVVYLKQEKRDEGWIDTAMCVFMCASTCVY